MKSNPQRIAIVGAGLTGLTAAYDLSKSARGYDVTIYEASSQLGGLAAGFRGRPEWDWPLEHFYHHIFTNDEALIQMVEELDLAHILKIFHPVTSMFFEGKNYAFDSPLRLLTFPHLPFLDRLRMGMVLAYLRYHPRPPWREFDKKLADEWLERTMGRRAYAKLWRPMLEGKFDSFYNQVNLAWFWARIYKRTKNLGYFEGGFQAFIDGLAEHVRQQGVCINSSTSVRSIQVLPEEEFAIELEGQSKRFDKVLSTVSPGLMQRLVPDLPHSYLSQLADLKSMGAVVLTMALDRQLLQDGTYWVNVPKPAGLPFLALVEHTNMISPEHYDGDHLVYLGNYLNADHPHFDLSAEHLLEEFEPHLLVFNRDFDHKWVRGAWVHSAKYAQPVPTTGYREMIPNLRTPLPGLYFASMSQVYPWDRGTNYAVEMGRKVAAMMIADTHNGISS